MGYGLMGCEQKETVGKHREGVYGSFFNKEKSCPGNTDLEIKQIAGVICWLEIKYLVIM